jgi:hypothetical protein
MQVYLPDELYAAVKERGLPASELLQEAVRAEVRRLDLVGEARHYLEEIGDGAPEPTHAERERAEIVARRLGRSSPPRRATQR